MRFIILTLALLYTATPAYSETTENNRPNFLRHDSDQANKGNVESERLEPHTNDVLVSDDITEHTKVMNSIAKEVSNKESIILRNELSSSDKGPITAAGGALSSTECDGKNKDKCTNLDATCKWKDKECVPRCGKKNKSACADAKPACQWTNNECEPNPNMKCDGLGKQSCNDKELCKWKDNNTCAVACGKLDKDACIEEGKCKWDGSKCKSKNNTTPSPTKPAPKPEVECDGLGKNKCKDKELCKWKENTCVVACGKLNKDACISEGKCKWTNGKCKSKTNPKPTPKPEKVECGSTNKNACRAECSCRWNGSSCDVDCVVLNKSKCDKQRSCYYSNSKCNQEERFFGPGAVPKMQ